MFITLSLLASFYMRTFFVDTLAGAKLAKIGESSSRNSSGSTPAEKFSAVIRLVVVFSVVLPLFTRNMANKPYRPVH